MVKDSLSTEEEEYKFTEVSGPSSMAGYGATKPKKNWQPLIVLITLVVTGFLCYKFYRFIAVRFTKQELLSSVQQAQKKLKPLGEIPQKIKEKLPPMGEALSQSVKDFKEQLAKVDPRIESLTKDSGEVKEGLKYLYKAQEQLREQLSSTNTNIQKLQSLLQQQQTLLLQINGQMQQWKRALSSAPKKPSQHREKVRVPYYVRALMPGRAWVMNDKGEELSLAVGDYLPGYGQVRGIDALHSQVITEQGILGYKE